MQMRWSSREKELKRRAAKKQLTLTKSPIDGTFMIDLTSYVPLYPERIKTKPWAKKSKIFPPEAAIYDGATLREAEQFVREFVPPWSRKCDPNVAASIAKALTALADAARNSRRKTSGGTVIDLSQLPRGVLEALFGPWNRSRQVH
jgi:hypothetical protein